MTASYGWIDQGKTAIIETAAASGITLVEDEKRPLYASTYGTGLLIRDALDRGCEKVLVGLGGSATNDGGIGMAQALGFQFTNQDGKPINIYNNGLEPIGNIDSSHVHRRLRDVTFIAACDVETRLYGENGATAVFGPQKGVRPSQISTLDHVLRSLADAISHDLNVDVHALNGGGAAGGLGAGLAAFCGAQLQSGVELVLEVSRFKQRVKGASLVITGEGWTDRQTAMGKVPAGIGKAAEEAGVPVFCISGSLGDGWEDVKKSGIAALFSIMPKPASLEEAMKHAETWLSVTVCEVISAWRPFRR